ncbi:PorP/SprF family type IX secretion system membrane protein [Natronoflexus pectinivorans]|nr:type IX secretion system membrane protein PorP/SprF [Natronoflexus pectinivorans]
MMRWLLIILMFMMVASEMNAQQKLFMSHYMHNQFAINPAFAGSREVLTAFGGYRQQWTGAPRAPYAQYFTAHAPLKNENVALGLSLYNEQFPVVRNSGFAFAYAYRVRMTNGSRLSFSLSGGMEFSSASWDNVSLLQPDDPVFGYNETASEPQLRFGVAWYSSNYFVGFSIADLFYKNMFDEDSPFFEPGKSDYLITAGYLYDVSQTLSLQPSALLRYNPDLSTTLDVSGTVILHNLIWAGVTYRSNNELIGLLGWQVTPQLRLAYSYDYPTGDLSNLNSGSHEVSLQFDFGYRIATVSPKFF